VNFDPLGPQGCTAESHPGRTDYGPQSPPFTSSASGEPRLNIYRRCDRKYTATGSYES
jgi:hypothetical protein